MPSTNVTNNNKKKNKNNSFMLKNVGYRFRVVCFCADSSVIQHSAFYTNYIGATDL